MLDTEIWVWLQDSEKVAKIKQDPADEYLERNHSVVERDGQCSV